RPSRGAREGVLAAPPSRASSTRRASPRGRDARHPALSASLRVAVVITGSRSFSVRRSTRGHSCFDKTSWPTWWKRASSLEVQVRCRTRAFGAAASPPRIEERHSYLQPPRRVQRTASPRRPHPDTSDLFEL